MEAKNVVDHAIFLASGDSLSVRRIGEYADWDENLQRKCVADIDKRIGKLEEALRYNLPTEVDAHTLNGLRKAFVMATASAGDRIRSAPPRRTSSQRAAADASRVQVRLSIQFVTEDKELITLADGRLPVLVRTWEFKWMPTNGDIVTLFGYKNRAFKVLVMETVPEPPQVLAFALAHMWPEFLSRGFEFVL